MLEDEDNFLWFFWNLSLEVVTLVKKCFYKRRRGMGARRGSFSVDVLPSHSAWVPNHMVHYTALSLLPGDYPNI